MSGFHTATLCADCDPPVVAISTGYGSRCPRCGQVEDPPHGRRFVTLDDGPLARKILKTPRSVRTGTRGCSPSLRGGCWIAWGAHPDERRSDRMQGLQRQAAAGLVRPEPEDGAPPGARDDRMRARRRTR